MESCLPHLKGLGQDMVLGLSWHTLIDLSPKNGRGRCLTFSDALKLPKCEIFYPSFFTPINPIWVGDLRTGEKNFFLRRYSPFCFFYSGWTCAKNLPTQAEPALNIAYAGWACANNLPTQAEPALKKSIKIGNIRHFVFFKQAEPALKNCLRRLSLRKQFA